MNNCAFIGRLTSDIELRRTNSGKAVASYSLAVKRPRVADTTDFIELVTWEQGAEYLAKYAHKGDIVGAVGSLQPREWTDKDGNKRRNAEVVADSVYFGDSKKSSEGTSSYQAPNSSQAYTGDFQKAMDLYNQATSAQSDFAMLDDDDAQLPF